ncbi:uncharacterized protein [Parasteatoda tepidariorum]|uniref:uncharacterized protein isoform X2 n=1 Tax=Parasteatoda tepidariorum TaxID=114398 RepID=UPI001C722701|nr:uncharacterized protein LOC107441320 isoform X1 [Parasteatoda tepidariorum]
MSANEKHGFMYLWNIKNFDRFVESATINTIISPSFKIEFLKGTELNLILSKWCKKIVCRIRRESCSEIPERISVHYQYELTTSAGVILKTSALLSDTFNDTFRDISNEYEIMELTDSSTPEDVSLRCRIILPCIIPSIISSPPSVVGWEAETDIVAARYPFEWSLVFSGNNKLTAVESVTVENIPIDVKFKYVEHELKIKLIPKIIDNKFHTVWCTMNLKVNRKSVDMTYGWRQNFKFSNTTTEYKFIHSVNKLLREEAICSLYKILNMGVMFEYSDNASITEIKNFNKNSPSVERAALTQNKDEIDSLLNLQQHLRNMLNEKHYADVKLRADGEVFFAHKCLLASRSPEFRAMFDREMLKSKTSVIDMRDVEAKTLKYFLEYLYTGTVDGMDDKMALNLLIVADKYQVSSLVEKCSTFLKSALNFDNVLSILLVADLVNYEPMKVFIIEYIVENSSEVLSLPNWPQWMKMNSLIASEVLLKLSCKFDSNFKKKCVESVLETSKEASLSPVNSQKKELVAGSSKEASVPPVNSQKTVNSQKKELVAGSSKEVLKQSQELCSTILESEGRKMNT